MLDFPSEHLLAIGDWLLVVCEEKQALQQKQKRLDASGSARADVIAFRSLAPPTTQALTSSQFKSAVSLCVCVCVCKQNQNQLEHRTLLELCYSSASAASLRQPLAVQPGCLLRGSASS